ncbi:UNVERIFIED_CONTAM: Retrovirus-related Pol polyprotein from transposon TNT 1-94 [Sesamum latifolium]|uniref:Retrovirus-related Pol polyprotein from transposon TNT 1-94 n=1 Tax=Sesamum latifolium TaxID=2727402 RepID=A0AAW2XF21_9LAMI
MSKIPYASAIGSIMYAMVCTRPDVSCALSMTSRFQSCPGNDHWTAVKNFLKYLNRTKDYFLTYGDEYELCVKGYTDTSFQTDKDNYRSQCGYVFILQLKLNTLLQLKLRRRKDIKVCKTVTDDNVADPLTRPMSQKKHERHVTEMGIKPIRE